MRWKEEGKARKKEDPQIAKGKMNCLGYKIRWLSMLKTQVNQGKEKDPGPNN